MKKFNADQFREDKLPDEMSPNEINEYYDKINTSTEKISTVISALNNDMDELREKAYLQALKLLTLLQKAAEGDEVEMNPDDFKELAVILQMGLELRTAH